GSTAARRHARSAEGAAEQECGDRALEGDRPLGRRLWRGQSGQQRHGAGAFATVALPDERGGPDRQCPRRPGPGRAAGDCAALAGERVPATWRPGAAAADAELPPRPAAADAPLRRGGWVSVLSIKPAGESASLRGSTRGVRKASPRGLAHASSLLQLP